MEVNCLRRQSWHVWLNTGPTLNKEHLQLFPQHACTPPTGRCTSCSWGLGKHPCREGCVLLPGSAWLVLTMQAAADNLAFAFIGVLW